MNYIFAIALFVFLGLYFAHRSFLQKEQEVLGTVHKCLGMNMRVVKFQMSAGEDSLENVLPPGYVHAGHLEMTGFLEQNSSLTFYCLLFAFRGKNPHQSIKPNDEACMRVWDGRREFVKSENVFDERSIVFRGCAYALLVESV